MAKRFRFLATFLVTATLGTTALSLTVESAYAGCNSGLGRFDPTCPGRPLGRPDNGGTAPSRIPTQVDTQINASISNGTGATVRNMYMRPSGQSNWGVDQLGNKTLSPSAIWRIGLPRSQGCFWDVRFQYQNGSVRDYPRVNFCTNPGIGLV